MLALLPQFDLGEDLLDRLRKTLPQKQQADAVRYVLETVANVFMFARGLVAGGNNSSSSRFQRAIFLPSLSEARVSDDGPALPAAPSANIPTQPPTLGHVLRQVQRLTQRLTAAQRGLEDASAKLRGIDHLSSAELCALVPGDVGDRMSASEKRQLASERLSESVERLDHEVLLTAGAAENALLLVWRHLEYFLVYASAGSGLNPFQKAAHRRGKRK